MIKNWEKNKSESAKKPTFYLELHNFSFQRNDYQKQSRGFIGRKVVRARLRSILNHSEQRSGTYLITGSRGVGKTSLVNKVLNELAGEEYAEPNIRYFIYVLICTLASTALIKLYDGYTQYVAVTVVSLLIALFFSVIYFVHFSFYRKRGNTFCKGWKSIILQELFLWNQFQTSQSGKVQFRVRVLACTFFIQLLTLVLSSMQLVLLDTLIIVQRMVIFLFIFFVVSVFFRWIDVVEYLKISIWALLIESIISFSIIYLDKLCLSAPLLALCYGILVILAYVAYRIYNQLLRTGNLTSEWLRKSKIQKGLLYDVFGCRGNDKVVKYYKCISSLVVVAIAIEIILLISYYGYTWQYYYFEDNKSICSIILLMTSWLLAILTFF